ncbi:MAG TPA: anaerobic nitric oxide reductase flavorubredoxin [Spirochaetota bacterium]|nr:anaerobic nitric oxide reductase flavorubredoxin [Spirochaetota bacterium]HPU87601.1 anaerobic nitric oxide reductase flavorubredoxin [Spirochaetota bacterium]
MAIQVKNNVWWVGKTDWELRKFHGSEYSTHRGTSYNSYLVREEKTALIDTVWRPFADEYVDNLAKTIDLSKIDFVVANHAEIDHSGALPELMERIPEAPVYCTANGVKSLKGHYHRDWNFVPVKTGDRISLGSKELIFIEAPMLHWPDSMFCYLTGDNILFSNDAFGQHYATSGLFNDLADPAELFAECVKYYANILTPFSPLVLKKIAEFVSLSLPLDIICTSHGVIWRDNPMQIVERYLAWADAYRENRIAILYDTMWNGTRVLAEQMAKGVVEADPSVTVELFNVATTDKNDVITEVFKSKGIMVGSPTINRSVLSSVAAILDQIHGLQFKGKKAAGFGCYGWSGESVTDINERLGKAGFDVMPDGFKALWNPDEKSRDDAVRFGRSFAEFCRG